MTSPFSDELISAYLDGELTAEEQARVEKQLRDDAELRRMCDELRVLRATLQSMPVAEPGHDLADRVLRQAERRMLTGDEGAARTPAPRTTIRQRDSVGTPLLRSWRVVAGAVASLAALLLLTLWLPSQLPWGRTVATSQQAPTDTTAKTMEADHRLTSRRKEMLSEGIDERLRDLPASSEGAAQAAGNATTRPFAADANNGRDFDDAARGGKGILKADREAAGTTTDMYGTAARSSGVPEQKTAAASNGSSFGMSGSIPKPPFYSPSAAQPEAMRLEPAGQERDVAVPMRANTAASPAAPGKNLQPGATTKTPPPADNNQNSAVGQPLPHMQEDERSFIDPATIANLPQESRQAVAQQLISEFDKNQVLLVQVSLPARAREDSSASLSESVLGAARMDRKAVVLWPKLPFLSRSAVPQESSETLGEQLAYPMQEVILVEGSPDQIRTSLTNLVAQPEVQVVATNASQEQLRSLHIAMDDLSHDRGVLPGSGAPMGGSGAAMGSVYGGGMGGAMGMGPGGMGGAMVPGGMGGYGGVAPSGMIPGAGLAGGGSGNPAEQGGYPGMGAVGSSSMPGQAPQNAPRSGGAKPGQDAGSAADGVASGGAAAGRSKKNSQGLEKEQPKMAELSKPAVQGETKGEGELGDALRQQEAAESNVDKPGSPPAGQPSAAAKRARPTGEVLGRRGKAGLDSAQSEEAASSDQQPAARTVVTYLFRLKPDAASAAPAKQE